MLHQPKSPSILSAFLVPGTPSFADLIARIEADTTLIPTRRRDLASGLRRVAKALGLPPEAVPSDPKWLQPRIAAVAPAAIGLSAKSWTNAVSDAKRAMAQYDRVKQRVNRPKDLDPTWRALWLEFKADGAPHLQRGLVRFVYWASARGLAPDKVSDKICVEYREALEAEEIRKSPEETYRKVIQCWNRAAERHAFWPQQRLSAPSRRVLVRLPDADYHEDFHAAVERYLQSRANPDPFDPSGPTRAIKPDTVRGLRFQLYHFAGAVIRSGVPSERIQSLEELCDPDVVRQGFTWLYERNGKDISGAMRDTAAMLEGLSRRLGLPEDKRTPLGQILKSLERVRTVQMTDRNRKRLRPLQDPDTLYRLLDLPRVLHERADGMKSAAKASRWREAGVAIAILLFAPIRRKNLVEIRTDQHLKRPGDGRCYLEFERSEVKNGQWLGYDLPAAVVALIDRHLSTRSPVLCPKGTPWLFPRRDGTGPMDRGSMSTLVAKTIRRELGLEMHLHLFRHLAATNYLRMRPGEYEVVRQLIGHTRTSNTIAYYAAFEELHASQRYSALLEEMVR